MRVLLLAVVLPHLLSACATQLEDFNVPPKLSPVKYGGVSHPQYVPEAAAYPLVPQIPHADPNSGAVYSIWEAGSEEPATMRRVDQRIEPNDIDIESGRWERIGTDVTLRGGPVRVTLRSSTADGTLVAEAIRLVRLRSRMQ